MYYQASFCLIKVLVLTSRVHGLSFLCDLHFDLHREKTLQRLR